MKTQGIVSQHSTYNVFAKKDGNDIYIYFVEKGLEKPKDDVYAHSAAGQARSKNVYYLEIRDGVCTSGYLHPAEFGKYAFLGEMSGYGVNTFFNERGSIKNIRNYIKDFGVPHKKRKFLVRLFRFLFLK